MTTIRERFGGDVESIVFAKGKNGCGLYTIHKPNNIITVVKTEIETKVSASLKELCKAWGLDYHE